MIAVDTIGFLNRVTGHQLLLWKVIATTTVFALAGLQVLLAARFYGRTAFPANGGTAAALHRWSGRVALVLAVLVAYSCVAGPAGPTSPTRVLLHSIFGIAAFVVLTVKFLILRVVKGGDKALPIAGISLFLVFAAIWATSVADYVTAR
ncbi:MAG: hypothetical protein JO087_11045 [Actinobacteria bacterium]|nr:hypothetical protein [Actinomycetota bacterium]